MRFGSVVIHRQAGGLDVFCGNRGDEGDLIMIAYMVAIGEFIEIVEIAEIVEIVEILKNVDIQRRSLYVSACNATRQC